MIGFRFGLRKFVLKFMGFVRSLLHCGPDSVCHRYDDAYNKYFTVMTSTVLIVKY
jgi:hypothetical protein